MPISAQQWRVKTGMMNASRGFRPTSIKPPSLFDLPPPDWKGYNTALVMVCLPLLCRIYAVCMAVMTHFAREELGTHGYVITGTSLDIRNSYTSYHQQSGMFLALVFYLATVIGVVLMGVWEYRERYKKLIQPLQDMNVIWIEMDSGRELSVQVRPMMIVMDTLSSPKFVRNPGNSRKRVVSEVTCVGVVSFILAILLLMAGDVERNPGPPALVIETLVNELRAVREKYREIGIQLGIGQTDINRIGLEHATIDRRLSEMLSFWLEGNTTVPVCWESIADALENVDERGLAKQLRANYCVSKKDTLSEDVHEYLDIHDQRTKLSAAAREGDVHRVSSILERTGIDVNFTDPVLSSSTYTTVPPPLLAACQADRVEVVRVLLKRKDTEVNFVYERWTPLRAAASKGFTEIMKLLLEHGACVDYVGGEHHVGVWTPLTVAANNGQYEAAVLLLQNGAKVEGTQSPFRKDTPLMLAAGRGHANLVELLINNGADVQGHRDMYPPVQSPLLIACRAGQLEVVRVLLKHKDIPVNIVCEKRTPLSAAAGYGHTEIMMLLLESGAGVDYVGDDPHVYMWTPVTVAARNGQYEAAVLLLQKGAKVDGNPSLLRGVTPLLLAAENGHAKLVQLLLDSGADVRKHRGYGSSPLTVACKRGQTECPKLLIQHGAPINEEDGYGETPLTCAAGRGFTECTRLLLEKGADINKSDDLKYTPLMRASESGYIDSVQLLLKHGADVNASSITGETALSLAGSRNHSKISDLLLKHGAKEKGTDFDNEVNHTEGIIEDREDDHVEESKKKAELDSEVTSSKDSIEDGKEEIEDDRVEDSEKEADAEDLGDPSETEHLAAVDRAMKEKGTLDHTLAQGVFSGPARSGKSSLMARLVGEMPSPISPSTGVAEQAIQVGVRKSSSIALGVLDSIWFKLLYDEEAIRLMTLASHITSLPPQQPVASLLQSVPENELPTLSLPTPLEPESVALPTLSRIPTGYVAPMGVFKAALRGRGLEGLRRHFENSWSLYLTDCGGQIEFQELLPLLVSGPSVFFLTFRLDQDLHHRFTIEYHLPDGGRSEPYQSTLTVLEAILQTLASIASMGTFTYKGAQTESDPLKPKVFIVGTHKDKLDPATADSDIKKIDQYLQGIIMSTSHYQEDLVEFASKFQMIYTVNNLSEDDSDFKKIRSGVERVVCHPKFKRSFPSHWLIFSLVLRQEMLKDSIISFEQCSAIAQDCGITDHEELNHALWFLHTKIGLVRHFPTPGLHDLVIRHPQILFDMVTKLIVNTFTFENVSKRRATEFEKKGIFTLEDFKQIEQATTPLLPPEKLLQLLEHLRIVAPFEEKGQRKYFLPCVLAHSDSCESPSLLQTSDIPPLLITFECGYCPKGLYGALMQCLLTHVGESKSNWELMTDQIYRDQVTFDVSPYDTITLKIHLKYLEIIHSCAAEANRDENVEDVCNNVRLSVEECIRKVSSNMKLTSYAKHSLSFYCGHPDCTPKEAHPATKITEKKDGSLCNLWCKKSGRTLRSCLPAGYSVWFGDIVFSGAHSRTASVATPHPDHTTSTVVDDLKKRELLTSTALTERDHLKICLYLQPLEERDIILLGQALGLLRSNLKKMKNLPDNMVDAWLIGADHVMETSGPPTWEGLCEALRDIGQGGVAAHIGH